jgi:alpha-galactosidase
MTTAIATTPFETLLLDSPSTAHLKYVTNNTETKFTVPLVSSTTLGQVQVEKVVTSLDANNYEVAYTFKPLESDVLLKHLEIEFDMELSGQVMMAEGFQCWSTTKELDRYSKLAAIPNIVSWFTQFNLQG